jgi:hypothetical protein
MVNILIVDNKIDFAMSLINLLNKNENIRVCAIAKNANEATKIIKENNNISAILLNLPIKNVKFLDSLKNNRKYQKSCIVIYDKRSKICNFINNNSIYTLIDKCEKKEVILSVINEFIYRKMTYKREEKIKNKIFNEISYLGFDITHKGTKYLLESIEYIILNPEKEVSKLERDIYPVLSKKYGESIHNIKCSINRATTSMYYECDVNKLKKYFYFRDDIKPSVKTIIDTIVNKI